MSDYTIYCTLEQTKKSFELGAPIEILPNYTEYRVFPLLKCKDGNDRPCIIPTAEQMIEWLEGQAVIDEINISKNWDEDGDYVWSFDFYDEKYNVIGQGGSYPSRKEATLAAIDAALEYLSNKK